MWVEFLAKRVNHCYCEALGMIVAKPAPPQVEGSARTSTQVGRGTMCRYVSLPRVASYQQNCAVLSALMSHSESVWLLLEPVRLI
jgi:hypothetical protein